MPEGDDRPSAANWNGSNFKTGTSSMSSSTLMLDTPFLREPRPELWHVKTRPKRELSTTLATLAMSVSGPARTFDLERQRVDTCPLIGLIQSSNGLKLRW